MHGETLKHERLFALWFFIAGKGEKLQEFAEW